MGQNIGLKIQSDTKVKGAEQSLVRKFKKDFVN